MTGWRHESVRGAGLNSFAGVRASASARFRDLNCGVGVPDAAFYIREADHGDPDQFSTTVKEDDNSWGAICHTCGNRWIARRYWRAARPDLCWRILDLRAAELVRTGLLSAWLPRVTWVHREKYRPYQDRGDYTDNRGLLLVIVAHHHQRGLRIPLTDDLWDAAVALAALGGPRAGARLLLDAASTANRAATQ